MPTPVHLGVDGGGTKTALILLSASTGEVLARHTAPGCNPSTSGPAAAVARLRSALADLLAAAPLTDLRVERTLLCMAGSPLFWTETAAALAAANSWDDVRTTDDARPVLQLAAPDGAPGLVLHGGTGSFVTALVPATATVAAIGRPDPFRPGWSTVYVGGLGWRFGDPGSGYDLGRRALARALLELQGAAPRTALATWLEQRFPHQAVSVLTRHFYTCDEPNAVLAACAPGILDLAQSGDPTARRIVADSTGELLDLATALATRLFPAQPLAEIPATLSGPILTHPVVRALLAARSPLRLSPLAAAPIEGVSALLRAWISRNEVIQT